ncbi:MAG: hypothetical protein Q9219_004776 [cf. Caloplaca sp. 3 TL-2023]
MKFASFGIALSSASLVSPVFARIGLSPDAVPLLTRTVDYTFHTICNDFHNPVPSPMFDETDLASVILAFTSDLYTFLMGYSVGAKTGEEERDPSSHFGERSGKIVEDLVEEIINSDRRSNLLESQVPLVKGPLVPEIRKEVPTAHKYAADQLDCPQFQRDLSEFSESFKVP